MIMNDADITVEQTISKGEFISPFISQLENKDVISYGLSSFGYDARIAPTIRKLFKNVGGVLDPKNPQLHRKFNIETHEESFILKPGEFALAHTVEYFKMPNNVMAVCLGKSTYARLGLIVNVTPLEPSWEGQVTLELQNPTCQPIRIYVGEGICQFIFHRARNGCLTTYADRKGKYQGQKGVTLAKVKGCVPA